MFRKEANLRDSKVTVCAHLYKETNSLVKKISFAFEDILLNVQHALLMPASLPHWDVGKIK